MERFDGAGGVKLSWKIKQFPLLQNTKTRTFVVRIKTKKGKQRNRRKAAET